MALSSSQLESKTPTSPSIRLNELKTQLGRISQVEEFHPIMEEIRQLGTFAAFYYLGELYYYGLNIIAPAANARFILHPSTTEAIANFKQAYQLYQQKGDTDQPLAETFQRLKVEVLKEEKIVSTHCPHQEMTLEIANKLLASALAGNSESLYQLAQFYHEEVQAEPGARLTGHMTLQLRTWEKRCLQAASDLYHPHAAYMLLNEFSDELSDKEQLRLSIIAADPSYADHLLNLDKVATKVAVGGVTDKGSVTMSATATTVATYRNSFVPLTNPYICIKTGKVHDKLKRDIPINHAKMGGIFESSIISKGAIILPRCHTPRLATTHLTPEEMRKARLKAITGSVKESKASASSSRSSMLKKPKIETPISRQAIKKSTSYCSQSLTEIIIDLKKEISKGEDKCETKEVASATKMSPRKKYLIFSREGKMQVIFFRWIDNPKNPKIEQFKRLGWAHIVFSADGKGCTLKAPRKHYPAVKTLEQLEEQIKDYYHNIFINYCERQERPSLACRYALINGTLVNKSSSAQTKNSLTSIPATFKR